MSVREYLSCAATAKLVRQALKESFPGVKFSVKSSVYSGGASITARWVDGPSGKAVDQVLDRFEGSYFDGMIDYKGSCYHMLDGKPVRFGADFIFGERKIGQALAEKIAEQLRRKGWKVEVKGGPESFYFDGGNGIVNHIPPYAIAEAEEAAGSMQPVESPTLARVAFQGDDGYGQGTVGLPGGNGGDQCAKAIFERQEAQRLLAAAPRPAPRPALLLIQGGRA